MDAEERLLLQLHFKKKNHAPMLTPKVDSHINAALRSVCFCQGKQVLGIKSKFTIE